jgi:hypothetical protein
MLGMDAPLTPTEICRLLATGDRLRVVAALALGADGAEEVGARTGLGAREVSAALARLTTGGLVEREPGGRLRLRAEAIEKAARTSAEAPKHVGAGAADPEEAAVLRAFMPAGKVVAMPAAQPKRRIVLDRLAQAFEPGRRYSEREVNAILGALREPPHRSGSIPPDHVTLRRLLVDEGFLSRDGGDYWRSGGTVEV